MARAAVDTGVTVDVAIPEADVATPRHVRSKFGYLFDPASSPGLIVYLHGMGASPEDSCHYFEPAAIANNAVLICPRGNARQSQGGAWIGNLDDKRYSLDQIMKDRPAGATLMGFSIGAHFAYQLAKSEPGKWSGLILMNQVMVIEKADLEKAGVKKLVLCAGEYDASHPALYAEKQKLAKAGFPVRFVTLGPVGHRFAPDMETRMVDAIGWVQAP